MGAPKPEILLVEDSRTQAMRLTHILEKGGYAVCVASNGREALEMLEKRRPALVISDVIMPEIDGYELCSRIRSHPTLKDIPVLLVTYLSQIEDVLRGLEAGANNFVMKPFESQPLLARIRRTLAASGCGQSPFPCPVPVGRHTFEIQSDRRDILEVLLSTYETALQRNERLAAAKEELRIANQELKAFSSSVSHDLRTPLSVILGYADFLLTAGGDLSEETRLSLEAIHQAGEKMNRLIEDLLNLSQASRAEIKREGIDLSALVEEIAREIMSEEPQRKADLRVEKGLTISGDSSLLHIALENLLRNAWKFTSRKDVALIEVGKDPQTQAVFIRDNGAGFDMKEADKIFASFRRLHSQSEFPGTGLGLATVHRIITRHGGRIWARGEIGEGATFFFTLENGGS